MEPAWAGHRVDRYVNIYITDFSVSLLYYICKTKEIKTQPAWAGHVKDINGGTLCLEHTSPEKTTS